METILRVEIPVSRTVLVSRQISGIMLHMNDMAKRVVVWCGRVLHSNKVIDYEIIIDVKIARRWRRWRLCQHSFIGRIAVVKKELKTARSAGGELY